MTLYKSPETLDETYALLAAKDWKILSGGTDFYPSLGQGTVDFNVLDVSRISSLRAIEKDYYGNWHIGALVTWTDIINHDLPAAFDSLKLSAREVGSVQIQNRATLVGNICNASPAADGIPPLLTLGAIVKIGAKNGMREVPLNDFIRGNRQIDLKPNEMVIGLKIPASQTEGKSTFLKLGARKYLVISISMVAVRLSADTDGKIKDVAISVGSCSLIAKRLTSLEKLLVGHNIKDKLATCIKEEHFDILSPIDDVRASRIYRMQASKELVARALNTLKRDH